MRFFPRDTGKGLFSRKSPRKGGHFPFIAWGKSHVAGGRKSGLTNQCAPGPEGYFHTFGHLRLVVAVSQAKNPDPPMPAFFFFRFPCFSHFPIFLAFFFCAFCFVFQGFLGVPRREQTLLFAAFPAFFPPKKKQGLEGQGTWRFGICNVETQRLRLRLRFIWHSKGRSSLGGGAGHADLAIREVRSLSVTVRTAKITDQTFISGVPKPVVWGTYGFAPWIPVVFVIFVVSVISANPALNSLFVAV